MKKSVFLTLLFISSSIFGFEARPSRSDSFTKYGDFAQYLIPMTAVSHAIYFDDTQGLMNFAKAFNSTLLSTAVIKSTTNRTRPNGGRNSFPSGHTSASFTGASYLYHRVGAFEGVLAYSASTLVGLSRVHGHYHHWSDVVAGALIGHYSGKYFCTGYDNAYDFFLVPTIDRKNQEFSISSRIRF